jgi:hypothetical protein
MTIRGRQAAALDARGATLGSNHRGPLTDLRQNTMGGLVML